MMTAASHGDIRLTSFTPTTVNAIAECPYRVALLRLDPTLRRPNTYSALGNVAHALSERAWNGQFDGVPEEELRSALDVAWSELVGIEALKLRNAFRPAIPPEPEDWPGMELTRVRTVRRLRRLIDGRQPRATADSPGWVAAEEKLSDDASGLWGRLDRLERHGGVLRVVDLKSGLGQSEVKPSQLRQLLLYAVLVQRRFGEWPREVVIETARGQETVVPVDPGEAEAELASARAAVAAYNRAVAGVVSPAALATPSVDACRYCPARIVCAPYWEALKSTWPYQGAVRGMASDIAPGPAGVSVAVVVDSPHDTASQTLELHGSPPCELRVGPIRVVGAVQTSDPRKLRFAWDTLVRLG